MIKMLVLCLAVILAAVAMISGHLSPIERVWTFGFAVVLAGGALLIRDRATTGDSQTDNPVISLLQHAANRGQPNAQFLLGVMYNSGNGVPVNKDRSVFLLRLAAKQGHAKAQHTLGVMYFNGDDVAKDESEGARWLRLAAKQGHEDSQHILGVLYGMGRGVDMDTNESARWFRLAAEQGDAQMKYDLGVMYWHGHLVPHDKSRAAHFYRLAAEQGYANAQFNLAEMLYSGDGVEENESEAAHFYRLAAEQGHVEAQYNLGRMYDNGTGVAEDDREAVRWYRRAAEQGDAKAQCSLGVMYWNGEGVVENEKESYIWFSIAKVNGDTDAANSLRKLSWDEHLTDEEIKSAKREAAQRLAAIDARKAKREQGSEIESASGLSGAFLADKLPQTQSIAEIVFEKAWRSIVVIKTANGQGSGVIIRPNIVATNCHVADDGGEIAVYKHDNRRASTDTIFSATIRRRDNENDFCLLDVDGLWGIPAAVRKYDTLNIGENVYALGSPKGLDLSLFTGIISQLRQGETARYIQTNAAISPGSSGGGLFDSEANLIGILTSKIADEDVEGIGFAIPADLALNL